MGMDAVGFAENNTNITAMSDLMENLFVHIVEMELSMITKHAMMEEMIH